MPKDKISVYEETTVQVGESMFEVFPERLVFTQMLKVLCLRDEDTGKEVEVQVPNAGWSAKIVGAV